MSQYEIGGSSETCYLKVTTILETCDVIPCLYITAGMNKVLGSRAPPLVGRFVPFMAVAVANMVNIPCMRQQELKGKREILSLQCASSTLIPFLPEGVVVY